MPTANKAAANITLNKEKIAAKAKENPKVKEYKRRYKLKQRFRNSTGKTILALLQGIADSKTCR